MTRSFVRGSVARAEPFTCVVESAGGADQMSELLGQTLRELRNARGETLSDVSDRTGLSIAMLSRIERGDRLPSPKSMNLLAGHFGFAADDLLGDVAAHKMVSRYGRESASRAARQIMRSNRVAEDTGASRSRVHTPGAGPTSSDPDRSLDEAIRVIQRACANQAELLDAGTPERLFRMIAGLDALVRPPLELLARIAEDGGDPDAKRLAQHSLRSLRARR